MVQLASFSRFVLLATLLGVTLASPPAPRDDGGNGGQNDAAGPVQTPATSSLDIQPPAASLSARGGGISDQGSPSSVPDLQPTPLAARDDGGSGDQGAAAAGPVPTPAVSSFDAQPSAGSLGARDDGDQAPSGSPNGQQGSGEN